MPNALILSGGVAHDFPALAAEVGVLLGEAGVEAVVREDFEDAVADLCTVDILVVNMLRWRMDNVERYFDQRPRWGLSPSTGSRTAIAEFVHGGKPLLALHAAPICFDDWPEWRSILGARWQWERSGHPPYGPIRVRVHPQRHPVVEGLPTEVELVDEAYGFLDCTDDIVPLVESDHGGGTHPLVWARRVGAGRVVYDALGHAPESYHVPEHRQLVRQAVNWLLDTERPAGPTKRR